MAASLVVFITGGRVDHDGRTGVSVIASEAPQVLSLSHYPKRGDQAGVYT